MDCVIEGCSNASWKGKMVGNLCASCHAYFTKELASLEENPDYSQASKNRKAEIKNYLMNAELFQVREKWEKN